MVKEKKKSSADINLLAKSIVEQTTSQTNAQPMSTPTKNPAAVALGRLGGLKGGKARAKSLTAKRRKEIAQKAAKARWSQNLP